MEVRTGLWSLSGDVLAEIFSGPGISCSIVSLWKCGCLHFNAKLAQSIASVDLKDNMAVSWSRYPMLLSSLRSLRELSLSRGYYELSSPKITLETELLAIDGSKLTSLTLISAEIAKLWDGHLFAKTTQSATILPKIDLSTQFPQLSQLTINSPAIEHGNVDFLPKLPPNLTALTLPRMLITLSTGPIFSTLPRSLTTLTSDIKVISSTTPPNASQSSVTGMVSELTRIFADAPPQLHEISKLGFDFAPSLGVTNFLPKSLDDLEANFGFAHEYTCEDLESLPSYWRSLTLMKANFLALAKSSEWMKRLTAKLKQLTLIVNNANDHVWELHNLPSSLTKFELMNLTTMGRLTINWDGLLASPASCWPTNLAVFHVSAVIPRSALTVLPRTITGLGCKWLESAPFPVPHGLKRLSITFIETMKGDIFTQAISGIGDGIHGSNSTISETSGSSPSSPSWHSLMELQVHGARLPANQVPSRLRAMTLTGWDIKDFVQLPPTLETLDVRNLEGNFDEAGGNIFRGLPRRITSLALATKSTHPQNLSPMCFSHLNRLDSLKVTGLQFESAILANFNVSVVHLTTLSLRIWCETKTELDEYKRNLPLGLKSEKVVALHR